MKHEQQKQPLIPMEPELLAHLVVMLDTLTRLSLVLSDLNFELDSPHRQAAVRMTADCVARSKSCSHG